MVVQSMDLGSTKSPQGRSEGVSQDGLTGEGLLHSELTFLWQCHYPPSPAARPPPAAWFPVLRVEEMKLNWELQAGQPVSGRGMVSVFSF